MVQGPQSVKTHRARSISLDGSDASILETGYFRELVRPRRQSISRGWLLPVRDGDGEVVHKDLS